MLLNLACQEQTCFLQKKADAQRATFKEANMISETLSTKKVILPPSKKLIAEYLEWCKYLLPQKSLQIKGRAALFTWEIQKSSNEFSQWKASLNSCSLFFDGEMKGNPREASMGGIIFDRGKSVITYAWYLEEKPTTKMNGSLYTMACTQ